VIISGIEIAKQGSQKIEFSGRFHRNNMLEYCGCKDHEGKTSGSILHGLVFTHECTLLVNLCIHDMKKIPVDALGTLRNTEIYALISPKCGNSWIMPGTEFRSGDSSLK
jgi:hypothetical protein